MISTFISCALKPLQSAGKCKIGTKIQNHQGDVMHCMHGRCTTPLAEFSDHTGMSTTDAAVAAYRYWRADQIRTRMEQLSSDEHDARARIKAATEELKRLKSEWAALATEWDDIVNRPLPDNVDPTLWLPDEIMVMILCLVECIGFCCQVCRRWRALCNDSAVRRHERTARWDAYARETAVAFMLKNPYPYRGKDLSFATAGDLVASLGRCRYKGTTQVLRVWRPHAVMKACRMQVEVEDSRANAVAIQDGLVYANIGDVVQAFAPDFAAKTLKPVMSFSNLSAAKVTRLAAGKDVLVALSPAEIKFVWDREIGHRTSSVTDKRSRFRAVAIIPGTEYDVICCNRGAEVFVWGKSYHAYSALYLYARFKTLSGESVKAIASAKNRRDEIAVLTGDTVEVWTYLTGLIYQPTCLRRLAPEKNIWPIPTAVCMWTDGTIFTACETHIHVYLHFPGALGPDSLLPDYTIESELPVLGLAVSDRTCSLYGICEDVRQETRRLSDVVVTWGVITRGWRKMRKKAEGRR